MQVGRGVGTIGGTERQPLPQTRRRGEQYNRLNRQGANEMQIRPIATKTTGAQSPGALMVEGELPSDLHTRTLAHTQLHIFIYIQTHKYM